MAVENQDEGQNESAVDVIETPKEENPWELRYKRCREYQREVSLKFRAWAYQNIKPWRAGTKDYDEISSMIEERMTVLRPRALVAIAKVTSEVLVDHGNVDESDWSTTYHGVFHLVDGYEILDMISYARIDA